MRRLPFNKILNLRDLGGFPIDLRHYTTYGVFWRSDAPLVISDEEIKILQEFNLTTIIDMRNDEEIVRSPNPLASLPFISYHHIPFLNRTKMKDQANQMSDDLYSRTLDDIYIEIIEEHDNYKQIFTLLADAPGCSLFHCSAGKDRTGILSMLLFMLVGVDLPDIIADYEVSFTFLLKRCNELKEKYPDLKMHIMESKRETLIKFIDYFRATYGGVEEYLHQVGVDDHVIDKIKQKFITTR